MHEPRVYNNSERSTTVPRAPRSKAGVRFNYGVKRMVMYAECNLITLTSCEVGYVHVAWYGGSTIQLRCKNVPCIRSYYYTVRALARTLLLNVFLGKIFRGKSMFREIEGV